MPEDIIIPRKTRLTVAGQRYEVTEDLSDVPVSAVEIKAQKNPRVGYACQADPCASLQRERNRGKLIVVWTTANPLAAVGWLPACGNPDCGLPMSLYENHKESN